MATGFRRPEPLRIASVVGTRPEAIKIAPIALVAARRPGVVHRLIATGQHEDLFRDAIAAFGITVDLHLAPHPIDRFSADQVRAMRAAIKSALMRDPPDIVLVQGDTNSALAAAQAAQACGIPVGHVEAGLRSFDLDRPFPEERNRIAIGQIAALHFAPSPVAAENLAAEGVTDGVSITGNPGIDALMLMKPAANPSSAPNILVTCHRRESFGEPLERICDAILIIAARHDISISLPVHPNPEVRSTIERRLSNHPNINLVAPMEYPQMVCAIHHATLILSDSGGLQEECAALGIPLLLMREETERPEVVANGNAILVGSNTDRLVDETERLLTDPDHHANMSRPFFPYGKGGAASRILDAVARYFDAQTKLKRRNPCFLAAGDAWHPRYDTEMDPR